MLENVKKISKTAILAGMVILVQVIGQAASSPRRTVNTSRNVSKTSTLTTRYVYQRNEEGIAAVPLLMIPPKIGKEMLPAFTTMSDVQMGMGDRAFSIHVENLLEMPNSDKQVFLKNLIAIHGMKSTWERINKYMKRKGIENFSDPSGKLPYTFREDVNGVLTTWYVNSKTKSVKEFSFDKTGKEVPPTYVREAKRFYRCQTDSCRFLCSKEANGGFLAVEIGQMDQPCPMFTYGNADGAQYVSLGKAAFIINGQTQSAYRGDIQELQKEQKFLGELQKKHNLIAATQRVM